MNLRPFLFGKCLSSPAQEAAGVHPLEEQLRPMGEAAVLTEAQAEAVANASVLAQPCG